MNRTLAAATAVTVLSTVVLVSPAVADDRYGPGVSFDGQYLILDSDPLTWWAGVNEQYIEDVKDPSALVAEHAVKVQEKGPTEHVASMDTGLEVLSVSTDTEFEPVDTSELERALKMRVDYPAFSLDISKGKFAWDVKHLTAKTTPEKLDNYMAMAVAQHFPSVMAEDLKDAFRSADVKVTLGRDGVPVAVVDHELTGGVTELWRDYGVRNGEIFEEMDNPFRVHITFLAAAKEQDRTAVAEINDDLWQVVASNTGGNLWMTTESYFDNWDAEDQGFKYHPVQEEWLRDVMHYPWDFGDPWELMERGMDTWVVLKDNAPGSAFYTAVTWMADNRITAGYADGTFRKNKPVTRGEAAAFLHRYAGRGEDVEISSPFNDVRLGGANFNAISWMAKRGITTGDTRGNFGQSKPVARGQFAAFLYRMSGAEHTAPKVSPFKDIKPGGANYEAITWLAAEGITAGTKSGTFAPSKPITRGEFAVFLSRYDAGQ
ncbi:MAG: S-layer homology domain-containing protein [Micrococcus sp.]|nr:S-layer homology domain-containing protein [Micrococcus sp.]